MLVTDPLTGRKVLLAENRSQRPNDFVAGAVGNDLNTLGQCRTVVPARRDEVESLLAGHPPQTSPPQKPDCAFCRGNEADTPDALHCETDAAGNWVVRVVPNKYPAVQLNAQPCGAHEVIIESPVHHRRTGELSLEQTQAVLRAYASRLGYWDTDDRFAYGLLFKNVGPSAGASVEHLHSQLIALPVVPPYVALEQQALADHRRATGNCGWCDRLESVQAEGDRVVAESPGYLAFCPTASRQPYETWILPTEHTEACHAVADSPETTAQLARLLQSVVRAIETEIGTAGYNLMIHTGAGRHWRIEVLPRVSMLAGFELATGHYLNTLAPQRAAANLRKHIL